MIVLLVIVSVACLFWWLFSFVLRFLLSKLLGNQLKNKSHFYSASLPVPLLIVNLVTKDKHLCDSRSEPWHTACRQHFPLMRWQQSCMGLEAHLTSLTPAFIQSSWKNVFQSCTDFFSSLINVTHSLKSYGSTIEQEVYTWQIIFSKKMGTSSHSIRCKFYLHFNCSQAQTDTVKFAWQIFAKYAALQML